MKDKLTNKQIALLEKYNIDYNVKTKKELLINIDDVMTDYVDEIDEPTEDFMIIQRLYDDIYRNIPSDITKEEEHDFIKYFNKDVIIVFNDFTNLSGHCETITRKADSDYDEPELTITTKNGYIGVDYSDVLMIVGELDRIKTKDGRIGTVMAIWTNTTGLDVEFDDTAPETETIDIKDVLYKVEEKNNIDKIKNRIYELTDGITIEWKNEDIYIDPFSKNNIKIYYKNNEYNYENVDNLLNDKIFENKSLIEIEKEIKIK